MRISLGARNLCADIYEELDALYTYEEYLSRFIVLFGFNNGTEIAYHYFWERGIPVGAIIDNDKSKQNIVFQQTKVSSPSILSERMYDNALIIIASSYYGEMKKQLEGMGYNESKHIYKNKTFYERDTRYKIDMKQRNLTELSLRDIQKRTADILNYVHNICIKNDIRYYIAYGSLLGAIRHKGAIPWDDDIDLLMPLTDFRRFCDIMVRDEHYGIYSAFTSTRDCQAITKIAKIMDLETKATLKYFPLLLDGHIAIDIFPMGGYPSDVTEQQKYFDELRTFGGKWARAIHYHYGTERFSYEKQEKLLDTMNQLMSRYGFDSSEYVGSVACTPYNPVIRKKEDYDGTVLVSYENGEYYAPKGWKNILEASYGNFMKYPPLEQRVPSHFFDVYMKK